MGKYHKWKVLLIVALTAFSIYKAFPPQEKINLGLDLQGGMQLVLEVELDKISEDAREDATARVVEIIRNRIDEFGVQEPVITQQGSQFVVIQLPGVTDRERAKEVVAKTAHLEFKLVSNDNDKIEQAEAGAIPTGFEWKKLRDQYTGTSHVLLEQKAVLTGDHLTNAWVGFGQMGEATVQIEFDKDGAKKFDQITFQNVGRQLAIVLDGSVYSAPVIRDRIPNGQGVISGNFTPEEASDLSLVLRAGALPAPVKVIEERTVGPSLGHDSIQKGVRAGLVGVLLVVIFMPIFYLLSGVVANIGLLIYAILVIGSLAALKASLTLPGIAGFILSIGMAVDANVLIFERIREEKASGKTPRGAISSGYHKALSAILDSNITTLVTSLILFVFGTGPVKGFAVTLSIGIVASMFASLVVTRVIFDYLSAKNQHLNLNMLRIVGDTHIPFLKHRFFAYGLSVIVIVLGIATFVMRGQENYGVEFTGGTMTQIQFNKTVEISDLRSRFDAADSKGVVLQHFGPQEDNQFVIKTGESDTDLIEKVARDVAGEGGYELLRVDRIGPAVSGDLRKKALMAVAWACGAILLYLGWRFEWKFALAAVIAIFHDVVFTFGIFALSGREINIPIVAAILTVMGYSVNDTIVTFDRVRDNLKTMRRKKFSEIVDASINQVLGRTILTSATTLLAALALFFFGGAAINDFALILLVGFTIGTYSSIFVANALVVDWKAH